jgi:hypothetical protein
MISKIKGNPPEQPRYWTTLPPVKLKGVGTSLVESVNSFVVRLAHLAGTSTSAIFGKIRIDAAVQPISRNGPLGFGSISTDFDERLKALVNLTGDDNLKFGSFWWLNGVVQIFRIGGLLQGRRWCPMCYLAAENRLTWDPLIWSVDVAQHCELHGCRLIDACQSCGAPQHPWTPSARRTFCRLCKASLGGSGEMGPLTGYARWVEQQVRDIVELCSTPGRPRLSADTLSIYVDGLAQIAEVTGKLPATLRQAFEAKRQADSRGRRIRLRTAINLCSMQGISVKDMLLDPKGASSAPLIDLWASFESLPLAFGVHGRKAHAFSWGATRLLKGCSKLYLPPLDLLLAAIGLSAAVARDLKPEPFSKYSIRYRLQLLPDSSKKMRRALIKSLRISGIHPSHRGGRPLDKKFAPQVATECRIHLDTARGILKTAREFHKVLQRVKFIMAQPLPSILDDPAWTRRP